MSELFAQVNSKRVFCGRCRHERNQTPSAGGEFDSPTALTFFCGDCHAIYGVCRVCATYLPDGVTCPVCHLETLKAEDLNMLPNGINEHDLVPDPHKRPGHWYHAPTDAVFAMGPHWRPKRATTDEAALKNAQGGNSVYCDAARSLALFSLDDLHAKATAEYEIKGAADMDKVSLIAAIVRSKGYTINETAEEQAAMVAAAEAGSVAEPESDLLGKRIEVIVGRYTGKRGQISDVGDPAAGDKFAIRAILDGDGKEIPFAEISMVRLLTAEEVAADEAALKNAQGAASQS